jgi:MFS family permease
LLYALNQGIALGWTSPIILGLFVAFAVLAFAFVAYSVRAKDPILDLRLFANRVYSAAVFTSTFQSLAIFAVNLMVVYFLEVVQGEAPLRAAFALVPLSIVSSVLSPLGGMVSDRFGPRRPILVGLLAQTAGLVVLSTLQVGSSYLHVVLGLVLVGLGGGLFWSPSTSAAMGSAPRNRLGVAAATLATWRNTGMVVSYALTLAIAASGVPADAQSQLFLGNPVNLPPSVAGAFVDGMRAAFHLSIAICLLTAIGWWFAAEPADRLARGGAPLASAAAATE